jgi:hypothetical protein
MPIGVVPQGKIRTYNLRLTAALSTLQTHRSQTGSPAKPCVSNATLDKPGFSSNPMWYLWIEGSNQPGPFNQAIQLALL